MKYLLRFDSLYRRYPFIVGWTTNAVLFLLIILVLEKSHPAKVSVRESAPRVSLPSEVIKWRNR